MMIGEDIASFRAILRDCGGRLAALDVGDKRIGLAFCDAHWQFATPSHTLLRGKLGVDAPALKALLDKEQVVALVVGLPKNLDGSPSQQTQATKAYARALQPLLERPILLWDERWSTQAVERAMIAADVSRRQRAARVDAAAAAYILQGAIDALVNLPPIPESGTPTP